MANWGKVCVPLVSYVPHAHAQASQVVVGTKNGAGWGWAIQLWNCAVWTTARTARHLGPCTPWMSDGAWHTEGPLRLSLYHRNPTRAQGAPRDGARTYTMRALCVGDPAVVPPWGPKSWTRRGFTRRRIAGKLIQAADGRTVCAGLHTQAKA